MPDGFLLGAAFAGGLLALGLIAGLLWGRAVANKRTADKQANELQPMLSGLMQFTSSFSQDVSDYRSLIEVAAQQAAHLQTAEHTADPTASPSPLLRQIMEANDLLRKRLHDAEATLQGQSAELQSYMTEARTDALTGLPNRRAFDDEFTRRLGQFRRHGTPTGLLLLDVDRFKSVNDTHGHHIGDLVLKGIADALRGNARDCDLVARYGGEEFAMLLAGSSREEFENAAERVRQSIEKDLIAWDTGSIKATVSCGVTEALSGEDSHAIVQRTDEALYASKSGGRNCTHWHDGRRVLRVGGAATTVSPATTAGALPAQESFRTVCAELRRKLLEIAK